MFAEPHWYNLPYYRPVARATMVAQKLVHGDDAGPYHLFNAALCASACTLLYALLRRPPFGAPRGLAALGALAFAAHPIASSCVYPIASGRETLLPAVFSLAAVLSWVRGGRLAETAAAGMLALALLSKEQAVVVPGLFLLADLLGIARGPRRPSAAGWLARYAPVAAVLAADLLVRHAVLAGRASPALALGDEPLGPLRSLAYFVATAFAPGIALAYEPRLEVWCTPGRLALAGAAALALIAIAARAWTRAGRQIAFWASWIVLALLPTANVLVQEARFDERYGFLSLAALAGMLVTLAGPAWAEPRTRRIAAAAGGAAVLACAATSFHRGTYFRDDVAFLEQWVRSDPASAQAQSSLGCERYERGETEAAELHLRAAIELKPDYADALANLGALCLATGRTDEALVHLKRAVKLAPGMAHYHYNLALACRAASDLDGAIRHLRRALALRPEFPGAELALAKALEAEGGASGAAER